MIHEFISSRLSSDNHLFPYKHVIDDQKRIVSVLKKKLIGYNSISLPVRQINTIEIRKFNELLFLSEIVITTTCNQLNINGFSSTDAKTIKRIIESLF